MKPKKLKKCLKRSKKTIEIAHRDFNTAFNKMMDAADVLFLLIHDHCCAMKKAVVKKPAKKKSPQGGSCVKTKKKS